MSKKIDYTKWDKLDVSSSDDEEEFKKSSKKKSSSSSTKGTEFVDTSSMQEMLSSLPRKEESYVVVNTSKELPSSITEENIFETIKKTCYTLIESKPDICQINEEKLSEIFNDFNKSKLIDQFEINMSYHPPFQFPTINSKINFWCIHEILNFGSSYSTLIQKYCNTDFNDLILRGCISLFLENTSLDATFMRNLNPTKISSHFTIPLSVDETVQKAIKMQKPSPLAPLVELLSQTLFECGVILHRNSCNDFASFILLNSKNQKASSLLYSLVKTFPTFNDHWVYEKGNFISFFSKAQQLVLSLHMRFRSEINQLNFSDISQISGTTNSRLISYFISNNYLSLSESLKEKIHKGINLSKGEIEECCLRASVVVIIDKLKLIINQKNNETDYINDQQIQYFLTTKNLENSQKLHRTDNTNCY